MQEVFIGPCRLIHANCVDFLRSMDNVDSIVTDPPYGIAKKGGKWGRKAEHSWDMSAPEWIVNLLCKCKSMIVWGGNYFALPPSRGWLVWYKPDSVPSAADCELAWTSFDMNTAMISQSISATNAERCGHPTQKPLRVMDWTLSYVPTEHKTVLDPFMGSGTTGVACIRSGKQFIGIENDKKYFEIACNRIRRAWQEERSRLPTIDKPAMRQRSLNLLGFEAAT